ncbi:MAG: tRNA 2-thiocytidine(32) synthetase TtcA [Desulfuromonadaceae bacterium]|nr:tRNA 2-thiocytidine(32) synthetase TtcA [Desulfuromonadaceae bacterium]
MAKSTMEGIRRAAGKAIGDFGLICAGDRIAVGISGGKDSMALMAVLEELRRRAPIPYQLVGVTIDPGFGDFPSEKIATFFAGRGWELYVEKSAIRLILEAKLRPGSSPCSFCARLRRGILYTVAERLGCNKVALGHHLDDFIETLLLNQFYSGTLAAMSPKMLADNGRQTVIRPLIYVAEEEIRGLLEEQGLPVFDNPCPARFEDQKRQRIKALIDELRKEIPYVKESLLNSLRNVQPRHLADPRLSGGDS